MIAPEMSTTVPDRFPRTDDSAEPWPHAATLQQAAKKLIMMKRSGLRRLDFFAEKLDRQFRLNDGELQSVEMGCSEGIAPSDSLGSMALPEANVNHNLAYSAFACTSRGRSRSASFHNWKSFS